MLTKKELIEILELLSRSTLQGREVQGFVNLTNKIKEEIERSGKDDIKRDNAGT